MRLAQSRDYGEYSKEPDASTATVDTMLLLTDSVRLELTKSEEPEKLIFRNPDPLSRITCPVAHFESVADQTLALT